MKRLQVVLVIIASAILTAGTATALPGIDIEAALGGWQQSPSGQFAYVSSGPITENDILDIERDLRWDDEWRIHGRLKFDIPIIPTIYLMAAPATFEGDGQKDLDFDFGNGNITANVPFRSKLTFNQYDLALYYSIPLLKRATRDMLNIDLGLNARFIDAQAELQQADTGIDESESYSVTLPTVYLAAQFQPIERVALEFEGRGISWGDDSIYSLIGRLRVKVFGPMFVAGGYRYDTIEIEDSDVRVDADIQGPFLEAGVKF